MIDGNNDTIEWKCIVNIYEYQKANGFKLGNKLSKQHINFAENKMKVRYAVQVLSRSVADALFTLHDLKVPNFEYVLPTVKYLKCFDEIFDIMNSRSITQKFSKGPMSKLNEKQWKLCFEKSANYIVNLKTNTGKPILYSRRYSSFLGNC